MKSYIDPKWFETGVNFVTQNAAGFHTGGLKFFLPACGAGNLPQVYDIQVDVLWAGIGVTT